MAGLKDINLIDILLYLVLGLVVLTILSPFVPQLQGKFHSGPSLILVFAGIAATLAVVVVRNVAQGQAFDQKTMFAILIVFILIVLAALFLRKILPEAFTVYSQSLVAIHP